MAHTPTARYLVCWLCAHPIELKLRIPTKWDRLPMKAAAWHTSSRRGEPRR